MKTVSTALVTIVYLILMLSSTFMHASTVDQDMCGSKCGVRCSKASAHKRCMKYCIICCQKCLCVPSGTYGHKDECPCYRDLKNKKGTSKCP